MSTVDVQGAIDKAPLSRLHLFLLAAGSGVMLVDGLDIYMLGKFAPEVAHTFHEPVSAISLIFLLQQIGLTVGAFVISPIADRVGRKPVLMWSTFGFGILTLATVWAQSIVQMAVLRGAAGLFLAAIIPNTVALLSEFAPAKYRSTFVTISFAGYMCGGAVASLIVIFLLDKYGWQSALWVGGLTPLLLLPILYVCVPESMQFRANRNPYDPSIGRTLRRLVPNLSIPDGSFFKSGTNEKAKGKARLREVFTEGMGPVTGILWSVYFLALFTIALYASFAPTFFYELGHVSLQAYAAMSLVTLVVGVAGSWTIGFLMDRLRPIAVIAALYVIEAGTLVAMGWFPFGGFASIVTFGIFGYCKGAGQSGINAICAQIYPPRIRTTGVGWAFGIGRFGGVFAPVAGGVLLSVSLSLQQVFVILATLPLLLTVLLLLLGWVTRSSSDTRATAAAVSA